MAVSVALDACLRASRTVLRPPMQIDCYQRCSLPDSYSVAFRSQDQETISGSVVHLNLNP